MFASPAEFRGWVSRRSPPYQGGLGSAVTLLSLALPKVERYNGQPVYLFSLINNDSDEALDFRHHVIPNLEHWCGGKVALFSYGRTEKTAVYIGPREEWWKWISNACEDCRRRLAEGCNSGRCSHVGRE